MSGWYADNKIFISSPGHNVDHDGNSLHIYVKNFLQSKIGNLNNLVIYEDAVNKNGVSGMVCKSDKGTIRFLDILDNEGNKLEFTLDKNSTIGFRDSVRFETLSGEWFYYNYRSEIKEIQGVGSALYEVVATVTDEYRIKVYANSEEDAKETARTIDVANWDHPDIRPDLQDRVIVRHAKWGDFKAIVCP